MAKHSQRRFKRSQTAKKSNKTLSINNHKNYVKKLKTSIDHSKLANTYRPLITNYANINLSDLQIIALAKGLKYIPTPKHPHRSQLVEDFDNFARKMRVSYIMHDKDKKFAPFRPKSKWVPLDSENNILEEYLEQTKNEICHLRFTKQKPNLTTEERNALNELSKNHDIVIKKPDKTRGICIMSSFQYRKVGLQHLSSNHYEKIPYDKTHETAQHVYNSLVDMYNSKYINEDTCDFLDPFNSESDIRTNYMYFLPKVHKPPPDNLPFHARPIISGTNGPTSKISTFCDYFLKPIASQQSTYVKDTTDIINKIEANKYPPNILLATIDVTAMYCNIIQSEAIDIACNAYENSKLIYNINKPPTEHFRNLLSLILEHNTFCFDDTFYRQKIGLAMGSPVSPTLANLALYPLELEFLNTTNNIINYWRYLDDCLIIYQGTEEELKTDIAYLNSMHPTIKFTATISNTHIDYLDITIFKGNRFKESGILDIKMYTKNCETFMYLMPTSTHPPSTFSGFIKGEFLRIIRNSSNIEDAFERSNLFTEKLIIRGYKKEFINKIRSTVSHAERPNYLKTKQTEEMKFPLVFSTKFTGHLESYTLKQTLLKYWNHIENDRKLNTIFPKSPIIAFQRANNIQDNLVKAKLPPDEDLQILMDLQTE